VVSKRSFLLINTALGVTSAWSFLINVSITSLTEYTFHCLFVVVQYLLPILPHSGVHEWSWWDDDYAAIGVVYCGPEFHNCPDVGDLVPDLFLTVRSSPTKALSPIIFWVMEFTRKPVSINAFDDPFFLIVDSASFTKG